MVYKLFKVQQWLLEICSANFRKHLLIASRELKLSDKDSCQKGLHAFHQEPSRPEKQWTFKCENKAVLE